jgi:NAD(P)-dependent dehydrogenase (short-subunit alcohol dehydrogenase family)
MSTTATGLKEVALVVGAGDATGAAACRAFARDGFTVVAVRRNKGASLGELDAMVKSITDEGYDAHGFALDARRENEVIGLLDTIEKDIGTIRVCLHNIGPNLPMSIFDTTTQRYMKMFEISAVSGLIVGREVAKRMLAQGGEGTILFTGATASIRGAANFAAFSGAMSAKRTLAQSMARELGPLGIHVAHVIVDGIIDTPFHATDASPVPRPRYKQLAANDGIIDPDGIADAFLALVHQKKSAWTFEMDLRPWSETW